MNKFIQKLQNKPERERRKILLLSTFSITVVIFVFWAASFRNTLSDTTASNKTIETSPFSLLKNSLGNAYSGFSTDQSSTSSYASAPAVATSSIAGTTSVNQF